MRNVIVFAFLSTVALFPAVEPACADNIGTSILKELFGTATDVIKGEVDRSIQESHAKRAKKLGRVSGYCQAWHSGHRVTQKPCQVETSCQFDNICYLKYQWPNGVVSELVTKDQEPVSFDGKNAVVVQVGSDECVTANAIDIFCFTIEPRDELLSGEVALQLPAQPSLQGVPASDSTLPANSESNPPSQTAPIDTSDDQIDITDIGSSPQLATNEIAAQTTDGRPSFDSLIAQYQAVASDQTNPVSITKRCKIGRELIASHSAELQADLRDLLREQLTRDNCPA